MGCDLEVQNHDRLDQDIKLFDVMPTTIEDGIQDNGDENIRIKFRIVKGLLKKAMG